MTGQCVLRNDSMIVTDEQSAHVNCPWCGEWTRLEFVRGHLECPVCRNPVADCCDGEKEEAPEGA